MEPLKRSGELFPFRVRLTPSTSSLPETTAATETTSQLVPGADRPTLTCGLRMTEVADRDGLYLRLLDNRTPTLSELEAEATATESTSPPETFGTESTSGPLTTTTTSGSDSRPTSPQLPLRFPSALGSSHLERLTKEPCLLGMRTSATTLNTSSDPNKTESASLESGR